MRLLNKFLFVLIVCQLIFLKSSNASSSVSNLNTLTPKKQLMRFYRIEFNLLAGKICEKLKVISEQMLNDDDVQHSSSPLMAEFRKNLTHFQNIYIYYVRFGLNESLATVFSHMVYGFYAPLNATVHIKQLLTSSGYDDLRQQYKTEFKNFFLEKFANKFEQLKRNISNTSQLEKFVQRFSKCLQKAQECEEYECLLTNFRNNVLKLKDKFIGNIQRHMLDLNILVLYDYKDLFKSILQHPKFKKLSPAIKQRLTEISQKSDKSFVDINSILIMFHLGAQDLLENLLSQNADELTIKQERLIETILEDCGYKKPLENFINNCMDFIQNGFIDEVENFKASYEQEGSADDAPLMEVLEPLDRSSCNQRKGLALMSLDGLIGTGVKKWKL